MWKVNVKNYEIYEKIQFVKELSGVARVDGGEETTTEDRRGEEDMVGKVEETTDGVVEEEKTVVVMVKQLNVAILHVGSFVVIDCNGGGWKMGGEWGREGGK